MLVTQATEQVSPSDVVRPWWSGAGRIEAS